jgi:hypothetical protein
MAKKKKVEPRNPPKPDEWIRFNELGFQISTGAECRFLHKSPDMIRSGGRPELRAGTVKGVFSKNFMTFVKISDSTDGVERDVLVESVYEVKRNPPA